MRKKIGIISNQKILRYSKTELLEEMLQEWINEVVGDE